jgi:hypothetical protein
MAHYTQQQKKQIAPAVQALLKKHGLKGTLSVKYGHTVLLTIRSGPFHFLGESSGTNWEWLRDSPIDTYNVLEPDDKAKREEFVAIIKELYDIMNEGCRKKGSCFCNEKGEYETRYFDKSWFVEIKVGSSRKPFTITE